MKGLLGDDAGAQPFGVTSRVVTPDGNLGSA
jgi:hypothetical protein